MGNVIIMLYNAFILSPCQKTAIYKCKPFAILSRYWSYNNCFIFGKTDQGIFTVKVWRIADNGTSYLLNTSILNLYPSKNEDLIIPNSSYLQHNQEECRILISQFV